MGKSTISMAIFNSYVSLPEGTQDYDKTCHLFGSLLHIGTFLVSPRHSKQGLMIRSPKLEMENKRDIVRFPHISIIRLISSIYETNSALASASKEISSRDAPVRSPPKHSLI